VLSVCKAAQVSPEAVLRSAAERFLGQLKDYTHIHKEDQGERRSYMIPPLPCCDWLFLSTQTSLANYSHGLQFNVHWPDSSEITHKLKHNS